MGRHHIPAIVSIFPSSMFSPSDKIHKVCLSKTSWNPSYHSHPINLREVFDNPGKMCAIHDFCGNCGISSLHTFEYFMIYPFVNTTYIGGALPSPLLCGAYGYDCFIEARVSAISVFIFGGVR